MCRRLPEREKSSFLLSGSRHRSGRAQESQSGLQVPEGNQPESLFLEINYAINARKMFLGHAAQKFPVTWNKSGRDCTSTAMKIKERHEDRGFLEWWRRRKSDVNTFLLNHRNPRGIWAQTCTGGSFHRRKIDIDTLIGTSDR